MCNNKKFTIMKTKKNLVNLVLMSIVTVAASFSITACSDDMDDLDNSKANNGTEENVTRGELLDPIALNYFDFNSSADVQIMTSDTTKISVSKALADKLGITSFVDHPMGVWEGEHIRPYHIRATKEILSGDRYILDVVQSGIGEFLVNPVTLSTEFYKNPNASTTRGGSSNAYMDEEGVLHPEGVYIIHRPAEASEYMTRSNNDYPMEYFSADDVLNSNRTRGIVNGDYFKVNKSGNVINLKSELKKDIKYGSGKDTITVHVKAPVAFDLNYKLYIDCGRKKVVVPYLRGFDANINGSFSFKPEVTIGFEKKVKLLEQKTKICDFTAFSFKFTIGPVPFWVDVNPNMYIKFDATVGGAFYGGFKYEYEKTFKAGITHSNGFKGYGNTEVKKNEFTFITPRGTFSADAGVALMLGVDLIIDKVAGPKFSVGPKVQAKAAMTFAPLDTKKPLAFDASLKMGIYADLGVKLKFWKIDIAEWNTTFNLVKEKTLWSYEYPQDMDKKKNDPVTKVLDAATEAIKEAQEKSKEALFTGTNL